MADVPAVPLTLEGACVLHQMFQFDWKAWRQSPALERTAIAEEAMQALRILEHGDSGAAAERTGLYSQLGHKGDLMLLHFRDSVEALNRVELELAQTRLHDYLAVKHSYLSVVELGLYESSAKTYAKLVADGIVPHSPEWNDAIEDVLRRQSEAMAPRLHPSVPDAKYLCFYPMDRKRGEQANWYSVPMEERQRMMHEHGLVGRRYAGTVRQIISGSIGWDDWEWGVDLFADDPVAFKKLIYEMRFDRVSAEYALFGPFCIGVRLPVEKLGSWLGVDCETVKR